MSRVPIIRRDADGTIIDGTAEVTEIDQGETIGYSLFDFRDLDGNELALPSHSSFEAVMEMNVPDGYRGTVNFEITKFEVYQEPVSIWIPVAFVLCVMTILVLMFLWAN